MSSHYKIISFLLLSLFHTKVNAQSAEKDTAVIFPDKTWVVGLNTQLFFDFVTEDLFGGDSLRAPRIEFLARINYSTKRAIRFRAFGEFQSFTQQSLAPIPNPPFKTDRYSKLGIAIGHEWQFKLSEKWYGYYGVEIESYLLRSRKSKDEGSLLSPEGESQRRYDEQIKKGYSIAVLPFIGLGYQVTDRLSFTAEAKIISSYFRGTTEYKESFRLDDPQMTIPIPTPLKYQDDLISKGGKFYIKPYTGLFINYLF